jgi:hypothetical protein
MKLAHVALSAAAAAVVIPLSACSSGTSPGQAANLQACKDFAAYKTAEAAGSFPGVAAGNMSAFITNGPHNVNTNVGEPLRQDLARIVTVAYNGNVDTIHTDISRAAADCAAVTATSGDSSSPPGSKTAAQIAPAIKAAMVAASSVHISGTAGEGSQQVGIDASLNGTGISGTFSVNGAPFTIVVADGIAYVRLNSSDLESTGLPASDCVLLCGKYVQATASDAAQFAPFSLSRLMKEMLKAIPSAAGGTTELFEPASFRGHPVLQLIDAEYTIDVARTGTPYPLFISSSAPGSGHGSLAFSDWNSVPPVTAPAASQIVPT